MSKLKFGLALVSVVIVCHSALSLAKEKEENDDSAICLIVDSENIPRWGSEAAAEVVCQAARDQNVAVGRLTRERGDAERVLGVKLEARPDGFWLMAYYVVGDEQPEWYSTPVAGPNDLSRAADVIVSYLLPSLDVRQPKPVASEKEEQPPDAQSEECAVDDTVRQVFWVSAGVGWASESGYNALGGGFDIGGLGQKFGAVYRQQWVDDMHASEAVGLVGGGTEGARIAVGLGLSGVSYHSHVYPGFVAEVRAFGVRKAVGMGILLYGNFNEIDSYVGVSFELQVKLFRREVH